MQVLVEKGLHPSMRIRVRRGVLGLHVAEHVLGAHAASSRARGRIALYVKGVIDAGVDLDGHQAVGWHVRERHAGRRRVPVVEGAAQREQRHDDRTALRAAAERIGLTP